MVAERRLARPRAAPPHDAEAAPGAGWEALRRAAVAVERDPDTVEHGATSEELREPLEALCDVVRRAADGDPAPIARLVAPVPLDRLLRRLRAAFVREAADAALDAETLLPVLRGIECVQDHLEVDEAHRFVGRLQGAGGLELLLEVAHDLRSPLASILFLAETLRKGQSGPTNAVQERQLGLVYSAALGLTAVANDVIELARGGDRLVDLHPVPFSVAEIMQAVRDIVLPMAEEKGLEIRLTIPAVDSRVGHPGALNRVLLNLTTNALKFTATGFVELSAREVDRSRVQFAVRDTGRGIPPEVRRTLFDTFRRRRKPGEYTFSSAGLGLAICRKLVRAMGGDLQVETAPDFGTRFAFEVELPPSSRL